MLNNSFVQLLSSEWFGLIFTASCSVFLVLELFWNVGMKVIEGLNGREINSWLRIRCFNKRPWLLPWNKSPAISVRAQGMLISHFLSMVDLNKIRIACIRLVNVVMLIPTLFGATWGPSILHQMRCLSLLFSKHKVLVHCKVYESRMW